MLLAADFGDAPASYATVSATGAWHSAIGPTLGLLRDADVDGAPSATATGDDGAGIDDEDGVVFAPLYVGQNGATLTVEVANALSGAKLDAWIDFDADGTFLGIHERIADGMSVTEGANIISFDVPNWASSGATIARFRLSTSGGLGVGGGAADGEVEDHSVVLLPPRASDGVFSEGEFGTSVSPDRPSSVTVLDFDGDGDKDVLSSSGYPGKVFWHENNGAEDFTAREALVIPDYIDNLASADFDGDGDIDLFGTITLPSTQRIAWFENDGQRRFTERVVGESYYAHAGAELIDFDGDGDIDVVASDYYGRLGWFENDGSGHFELRLVENNPLLFMRKASVADVNGDGNLDIVVSGYVPNPPSYQVAWYENDGNFSFTRRATEIEQTFAVYNVLPGDMDGDGDVDLVNLNFVESSAAWHENDGNGHFTTRPITPLAATQFKLSDLDGDGDLDILGWNYDTSQIKLLTNHGLDNFTASFIDDVILSVVDVEIDDVNDDGVQDIVAVSHFRSTIAWYAGNAGAEYEKQFVSVPIRGPIVSAPDIDRDGDDDLVVVSYDDSSLYWYESTPNGKYYPRLISDSTFAPSAVEIVDLDGDGDLDIVAASISTSLLQWFENDGMQGFTKRVVTNLAHWAQKLNVVDFDADGDMDFVIADIIDDRIYLYRNDGAQQFQRRELTTNTVYANIAATGDFDGDGDIDIVATHSGGLGLAVHLNVGGTYLVTQPISDSNRATELTTGDFDGDGDIDLMATSSTSVNLYRNDAAAHFTRGVIANLNREFGGLQAADMDGDGDLDFSILDVEGGNDDRFRRLAWYENEGVESFTRRAVDESSGGPTSAMPFDADQDGDLDLAAVDYQTGRLVVYENRSTLRAEISAGSILEESAGTATITLTRGGDTGQVLPVSFTIGGSAGWNTDFTLTGAESFDGSTGTVLFPAGVDSIRLVVSVLDDDLVEPIETFQFSAILPAGYVASTSSSAAMSITSRDFRGDYGDAPPSYGTMLADDGARHLEAGPKLGSSRDAENDGPIAPGAAGDGSDEDGVTTTPLRAGDVNAAWSVAIEEAPTGARLDAWIDFNGDGAFDLAEERIAASLPVAAGINVVRFSVPADARAGTTFARFRVSTEGGLGPRGAAADGEVEDYAVEVEPPVASGGVFFPAANIAQGVNGVNDLSPVDFDQDGDLDLLAALPGSGEVAWLENIGLSSFVRRQVATQVTNVSKSIAIDLDSDGDLDALSFSSLTASLVWSENIGSMAFSSRVVAQEESSLRSVVPVDLDLDGDIDLVGIATTGGRLQWLENDGSESFSARVLITTNVAGADVVDLDRDGDVDVVATLGSGLVWLENLGDQEFTTRAVGSPTQLNAAIAISDLDGDGDFDVVTSRNSDRSILWFENDGAQSFTPREVGTTPSSVAAVEVIDLNGDGDADILPVVLVDAAPIWFDNLGAGTYARRSLDASIGRQTDLVAGDFDGDGDLDLAQASSETGIVALHKAASAVTVSAAPSTISEVGLASVKFTFMREGPTDTALGVSFEVGGIAAFGVDYAAVGAVSWNASTGVVTIPAGSSQVEVTITAIDDALLELDEDVSVRVVPGADYMPGVASFAFTNVTSNEFGGDLGDAPLPYPTQLGAGGAAHEAFGPRLGALRDAETDGAPHPLADGDGADEDGVIWSPLRVGQLDGAMQVRIQNAPAGARLDAWIDFNHDGSWGGAGEQISVSCDVIAGNETLLFDVPAWAVSGFTVARVRLSSAGGLGPGGTAADGEVEDYILEIQGPEGGDGLFPLVGAIDAAKDPTGFDDIVTADLDQDGDLDVIAASVARDRLIWYENDGVQNFTGRTISTTTDGPNSVVVADLDGDGDLDVATASRTDDLITWFENDGSQGFTRRIVFSGADDAVRIVAADLDGDGRQDLVSLSVKDGAIRWSRGLGGGAFATTQIGSASIASSPLLHHLAVVDVDRDGDLDVTSANIAVLPGQQTAYQIVWFVNDGHQAFARHTLFATPTLPNDALPVDLDRDGDLDYVVASRYLATTGAIAWFQNEGAGQYSKRTVVTPLLDYEEIDVADVDGDGDLDLVARSARSPRTLPSGAIAWFENDGAQQFTPRTTIAENATEFVLADFDQDGDIDIGGAFSSGSVLAWHRNVPRDAGDFNADGIVDGADYLVWQRGVGNQGGVLREQGDADGDGDADAADLRQWTSTFGLMAAPTTSVLSSSALSNSGLLNFTWGPIVNDEQSYRTMSQPPTTHDRSTVELTSRKPLNDVSGLTSKPATQSALHAWTADTMRLWAIRDAAFRQFSESLQPVNVRTRNVQSRLRLSQSLLTSQIDFAHSALRDS